MSASSFTWLEFSASKLGAWGLVQAVHELVHKICFPASFTALHEPAMASHWKKNAGL